MSPHNFTFLFLSELCCSSFTTWRFSQNSSPTSQLCDIVWWGWASRGLSPGGQGGLTAGTSREWHETLRVMLVTLFCGVLLLICKVQRTGRGWQEGLQHPVQPSSGNGATKAECWTSLSVHNPWATAPSTGEQGGERCFHLPRLFQKERKRCYNSGCCCMVVRHYKELHKVCFPG